jgi:hypothetical protein
MVHAVVGSVESLNKPDDQALVPGSMPLLLRLPALEPVLMLVPSALPVL